MAWVALMACGPAFDEDQPRTGDQARTDDVDTLLELITAAEDAYQQLIAEHIAYAETVLAEHIAGPGRQHGAAWPGPGDTERATTL